MELRQLRYFLSAAKHLSFTRAAEECCIVQSAMSQQIRALEKEMGATLFERTKRGLRLTPEGEVMAERARRLLEQAGAMQDAVKLARKNGEGSLRVGCQDELLREALPRALAAFRGAYPNVLVSVKRDLQQRVVAELRNERLDCAIVHPERPEEIPDGFRFHSIAEETACAMLPADSPLAALKKLSLQAFASVPMILYSSERNSPALNAVLHRYGATGPRTYADSQSDIETLVAAGYGASICAMSAARPHSAIVYRAIAELPRAHVCLVWHGEGAFEERIRAFASLLSMEASKIIGVF